MFPFAKYTGAIKKSPKLSFAITALSANARVDNITPAAIAFFILSPLKINGL
jgi:hypothetical protein